MKFLVVFACALAVATASGSHFVAPVAVEAHHVVAPVAPVYTGPQHLPVIGANGVPVDTAAVQHAKAAHLAHKVEAHARNGDVAVVAPVVHHTPVVTAHAPVVAPVVAAHHPVVATHHPVVAAHHSVVEAHHAVVEGHHPVVAPVHHHHHHTDAYPTTVVHPTSVNGVPQETPEVAAAKTHHFAAHAEALARNGDAHFRYARAIYTPYAYSYGAYPYSAYYGHYY